MLHSQKYKNSERHARMFPNDAMLLGMAKKDSYRDRKDYAQMHQATDALRQMLSKIISLYGKERLAKVGILPSSMSSSMFQTTSTAMDVPRALTVDQSNTTISKWLSDPPKEHRKEGLIWMNN